MTNFADSLASCSLDFSGLFGSAGCAMDPEESMSMMMSLGPVAVWAYHGLYRGSNSSKSPGQVVLVELLYKG